MSYDATYPEARKRGKGGNSGYLVPLPPIHTVGSPTGLAHIMAPVGLTTADNPGLVAPITILLRGEGRRNINSDESGDIVSILIGASHIGNMRLEWSDDLDCNPRTDSFVPPLANIMSCGPRVVAFLCRLAQGNIILSSMPPALLVVAGNQSNCALEVLTSTLSALETQKQYQAQSGHICRDRYAVLAEKIMGLVFYASLVLVLDQELSF